MGILDGIVEWIAEQVMNGLWAKDVILSPAGPPSPVP